MVGVAVYSVHHTLTEHVDLTTNGGGVTSSRLGDTDITHEDMLSSEEKTTYDIAVSFVGKSTRGACIFIDTLSVLKKVGLEFDCTKCRQLMDCSDFRCKCIDYIQALGIL